MAANIRVVCRDDKQLLSNGSPILTSCVHFLHFQFISFLYCICLTDVMLVKSPTRPPSWRVLGSLCLGCLLVLVCLPPECEPRCHPCAPLLHSSPPSCEPKPGRRLVSSSGLFLRVVSENSQLSVYVLSSEVVSKVVLLLLPLFEALEASVRMCSLALSVPSLPSVPSMPVLWVSQQCLTGNRFGRFSGDTVQNMCLEYWVLTGSHSVSH